MDDDVLAAVFHRGDVLSRRRLGLFAAFFALFSAIAVGAVVFVEPLFGAFWQFVGGRALSSGEASDLAACKSPGFWGWVKVLEQDLDVACDADFLVADLADKLNPGRELWLRSRTLHPGRPPRERARIALAVWTRRNEVVPGFSLLLSEPAATQERAVALDWAATHDVDLSWADPMFRREVGVRRGDPLVEPSALWIEAELSLHTAEQRREMVDVTLEPLGLSAERIGVIVDRRKAGLSLAEYPIELLPRLLDEGEACREVSSAACLRLAARLVELQRDDTEDLADAPSPVNAPTTVADPLWQLLYAGPGAVDAARTSFAASAEWIRSAPEDERGGRLLGLVAHRRHGYDDARTLGAGDPSLALALRRGSPWASALAAVTLGDLAGLPVQIEAINDAVVIRVAERQAVVGPCGAVITPPAPGEPWPEAAVLAQAATEAAGQALRAKQPVRAVALAALAERSDPVGAEGVTAVVAQLAGPASGSAGGIAAGTLMQGEATSPVGAEAARKARAATWAHAGVEWNGTPPACPSVLGP